MQFTQLGRSGLKVSRLCLGTMNFGPETSESDSFKIMDAALERGINFFDTANVYGRKIHLGFTEEIIGRWLAQGGAAREDRVGNQSLWWYGRRRERWTLKRVPHPQCL